MVRYIMAALVTKVSPDHPDVLRQRFAVKFAEEVRAKRVLYGLQAEGAAAPAQASHLWGSRPVRDVLQEVMDAAEYQDWREKRVGGYEWWDG